MGLWEIVTFQNDIDPRVLQLPRTGPAKWACYQLLSLHQAWAAPVSPVLTGLLQHDGRAHEGLVHSLLRLRLMMTRVTSSSAWLTSCTMFSLLCLFLSSPPPQPSPSHHHHTTDVITTTTITMTSSSTITVIVGIYCHRSPLPPRMISQEAPKNPQLFSLPNWISKVCLLIHHDTSTGRYRKYNYPFLTYLSTCLSIDLIFSYLITSVLSSQIYLPILIATPKKMEKQLPTTVNLQKNT